MERRILARWNILLHVKIRHGDCFEKNDVSEINGCIKGGGMVFIFMKLFKASSIITVLICFSSVNAADQIHFGSTGNPLNGLTVTWHSTNTNDSIKWGYTSGYEQGEFSGVRRTNYSGFLYDYAFPALQPSAILHYSLYDGSWGPEKTFKTSIDTSSTSFTFIASGDCQMNNYDLGIWKTNWQTCANAVGAEEADFNIQLGDHVSQLTAWGVSEWDSLFRYGINLFENKLIYHTIGNHDNTWDEYEQHLSGAALRICNLFVHPNNDNDFWYSFEFGNTAIICLNSQYPDSLAQYEWLLQTLQNANNTGKTWKAVFFHRPFFTQYRSASNNMDPYFGTWWKAFDDYGVDIVLNGHKHNYEVMKPVNMNMNTAAPVAEYGSGPDQGRLEIVSGNMGSENAPTPVAARPNSTFWYNDRSAYCLNYCKFQVNGNTMRISAVHPSGFLIDSFSLHKDISAAQRNMKASHPVAIDAFPDPFNASLTIHLQLPVAVKSKIEAHIFNIRGTLVDKLSADRAELSHGIPWNAGHLKSGVYVIRIKAGNNTFVKRVSLIK